MKRSKVNWKYIGMGVILVLLCWMMHRGTPDNMAIVREKVPGMQITQPSGSSEPVKSDLADSVRNRTIPAISIGYTHGFRY